LKQLKPVVLCRPVLLINIMFALAFANALAHHLSDNFFDDIISLSDLFCGPYSLEKPSPSHWIIEHRFVACQVSLLHSNYRISSGHRAAAFLVMLAFGTP